MTASSVRLFGGAAVSRRAARGARRLTKERAREKLARGLERAIRDAERPRGRLTSAIPVRRVAVLGARVQLQALAARLRAPEPVYSQGVAAVRALLVNAESPLYQPGLDLDAAVDDALAALDGHVE
jgi:hypothetical protein